MATSTQTATRPSPTTSTIWMKILMAVTGLYFVFFVLFHMYGNLKIMWGVEGFDEYAHHLRTMFMPILPYSGFLWLFRLSLIAAIAIHLWAASKTWAAANHARSEKYVHASTVKRSLSSKAMRWGGVTILLFILWHLAQFTVVKFTGNGHTAHDYMRDGVESPGLLVIASFQIWYIFLIYLLAMCALALHLHHGTYSAFQTLGWTNTEKARGLAKTVGALFALVVAGGFLIPPFLILIGVIK